MPFRFKIVNHAALLGRSDAAILYVGRRFYSIAAEVAFDRVRVRAREGREVGKVVEVVADEARGRVDISQEAFLRRRGWGLRRASKSRGRIRSGEKAR